MTIQCFSNVLTPASFVYFRSFRTTFWRYTDTASLSAVDRDINGQIIDLKMGERRREVQKNCVI